MQTFQSWALEDAVIENMGYGAVGRRQRKSGGCLSGGIGRNIGGSHSKCGHNETSFSGKRKLWTQRRCQ